MMRCGVVACVLLSVFVLSCVAADGAQAEEINGRAYLEKGVTAAFEGPVPMNPMNPMSPLVWVDIPVGNMPVKLYRIVSTMPKVRELVAMTMTADVLLPEENSMAGTFTFGEQPAGMIYEVELDVTSHPTAASMESIRLTDPENDPMAFVSIAFDKTETPSSPPVVTTGTPTPRVVGFPLVEGKPGDDTPGMNTISGRAYLEKGVTLAYEPGVDEPVPNLTARLYMLSPRVMLAQTDTGPMGEFDFPEQPANMAYEVVLDLTMHPTGAATDSILLTDPMNDPMAFVAIMFDKTETPASPPIVTSGTPTPRVVGFPLVEGKPEDDTGMNTISGRAYFERGTTPAYEPGIDETVPGLPVQLWLQVPPVLLATTLTGPMGEFAFPAQMPNLIYEVRLDLTVHPTAAATQSLVFQNAMGFIATNFDRTETPAAGPVVTSGTPTPRVVGFPLVEGKPEDPTTCPDACPCPDRDCGTPAKSRKSGKAGKSRKAAKSAKSKKKSGKSAKAPKKSKKDKKSWGRKSNRGHGKLMASKKARKHRRR